MVIDDYDDVDDEGKKPINFPDEMISRGHTIDCHAIHRSLSFLNQQKGMKPGQVNVDLF